MLYFDKLEKKPFKRLPWSHVALQRGEWGGFSQRGRIWLWVVGEGGAYYFMRKRAKWPEQPRQHGSRHVALAGRRWKQNFPRNTRTPFPKTRFQQSSAAASGAGAGARTVSFQSKPLDNFFFFWVKNHKGSNLRNL